MWGPAKKDSHGYDVRLFHLQQQKSIAWLDLFIFPLQAMPKTSGNTFICQRDVASDEGRGPRVGCFTQNKRERLKLT